MKKQVSFRAQTYLHVTDTPNSKSRKAYHCYGYIIPLKVLRRVALCLKHHQFFLGNLRLLSEIVGNVRKFSEIVPKRLPGLLTTFGEFLEIFGNCSEILRNSSKKSPLVCLYNKQDNTRSHYPEPSSPIQALRVNPFWWKGFYKNSFRGKFVTPKCVITNQPIRAQLSHAHLHVHF